MKMNKLLLVLLRLCASSNYRFIRRLSIFDAGYYLVKSNSKPESDIDPLWGYLKIRGNDYSQLDLSGSHWEQLADPHPLFDTFFYLCRYFPNGLDENPFIHYLKKGWKMGFCPGPFFDPEVYRVKSNWSESDGDPLTHYTHHGSKKSISPGQYFDINWYLNKDPDLIEVKTEIIKHYKIYGGCSGKSPLPVFDPAFYLKQLANPEKAAPDPLSHFITTADTTRHRPARWFDPDYYNKHYNKNSDRVSALAHYLEEGIHHLRYSDIRIAQLVEKPLLSIVVPVYNPDINFLNSCIQSVLYQSYPHWELCIADDGSSVEGIKELLELWQKKDTRIRVKFLETNQGISIATNAAAALARGDYLGFLDNDDELSLDCLYYITKTINYTKAELIYTDEDLIGEKGLPFSTFRKPDFNQELLLSHNYITHFVTVSRPLFEKVGGFDPLCDGAQDFDLILKLTEQTDKISHIPQVLYHWRASSTSTSINHDQKHYAHKAGKLALKKAVERRKTGATVEDTDLNFFYRLNYIQSAEKEIAILLWIDNFSEQHILKIIQLIEETGYNKSKFLLVSTNQQNLSQVIYNLASPALARKINIPPISQGIDKAEALHLAALSYEADFIVFLDQSIIHIENDWLEQLLGLFISSQTGVACGRALYEGSDGQSYTIPDIANESTEYFFAFLHSCTRHMNGLHCPQQVHFCGWDLTMVERSLYLNTGGLEFQQFPRILALADLAMKVAEHGRTLVYTPYSLANKSSTTDISASFTADEESYASEKTRFQQKWWRKLQKIDTFYNPGILKDNKINREDFTFWLSGRKHKI